MLCILRTALAAAVASTVAISACYAQSSPAGDAQAGAPAAGAGTPASSSPPATTGETLPPIVVQQAEPPRPPAKPKKAAVVRKPSAPRQPVTAERDPTVATGGVRAGRQSTGQSGNAFRRSRADHGSGEQPRCADRDCHRYLAP